MSTYTHNFKHPLVNAGYEQAAMADYWWMKELCSWGEDERLSEGYHAIHIMKAFHMTGEEL